jgi:hypothetical protein
MWAVFGERDRDSETPRKKLLVVFLVVVAACGGEAKRDDGDENVRRPMTAPLKITSARTASISRTSKPTASRNHDPARSPSMTLGQPP